MALLTGAEGVMISVKGLKAVAYQIIISALGPI